MIKPFALAELSARLRALLRRGAPRENVLRVADLEMDTIRRTVRRAGRPIDLHAQGIRAARVPDAQQRRPLTRSLIIEHVWDIHFDSVSNVVEVHINSLRNKIDRGFDAAADPHRPRRGIRALGSAAVTAHAAHAADAVYTALFGAAAGRSSRSVSYHVLARPARRRCDRRADRADARLHGYLRFDGDRPTLVFDRTIRSRRRSSRMPRAIYQVFDVAHRPSWSSSREALAPLGLALHARRSSRVRATPGRLRHQHRLRPDPVLEQRAHARRAGEIYLLQVGVSLAPDGRRARACSSTLLVERRRPDCSSSLVIGRWMAGVALAPLRGSPRRAGHRRRRPRIAPAVRGAGDELDEVAMAFNDTLGRLEHAVGDMRQFSAALAHELRTPLAALRGELEMALRVSAAPRMPPAAWPASSKRSTS